MTDKLLMLMDPIESIRPAKDTSLALLLEAQRRGYKLNITQQGDLALRDGDRGRASPRCASTMMKSTGSTSWILTGAHCRRCL